MADFALSGGVQALSAGFILADTDGTLITAAGGANTKGSYVELLSAASNTLDTFDIQVVFSCVSGTLANFLVDISIGGAGSEQVIIPNIYIKTAAQGLTNKIRFPLSIPAGSRISARCQSSVGGAALTVHAVLSNGNFKQGSGFSEVIAYGADTGSSSGTTVTRAAAGVFGSWVEIEASTADEINAIAIATIRAAGSWSNGAGNYQLAVGSAGNEEVILGNLTWSTNTAEAGSGLLSRTYMIDIPAGQRLSIRAAATASNVDFDNDYVIYGVK